MIEKERDSKLALGPTRADTEVSKTEVKSPKSHGADAIAQSEISQTEILLVEDSAVESELLRRILIRAGYAVSLAHNGEQGLQAARMSRPALVMSDINMPKMNGYQLCRAIKDDDALWNVPLMLLTVLSEPEDIIEAINAGADAYIIKPFSEADLLERIRALLDTPIKRPRLQERRGETVAYGGKRYVISAGGRQILNLMLSLYENMLNLSRELVAIQSELSLLNENLDTQVRKRTTALQISEERFRNLVETTNNWIWEVDQQAVYTYASPRIYDILGYRPEEVIGKRPFDLMPAEEAQRTAKLFEAKVSAYKAIVNFENINLHKDGRRVVLETNGVPIFGQNGELRGYLGIDRDITERKLAEAALVESENQIKAIFNAVQDGILVVDTQTKRFRMANAAICGMLGYGPDKLLDLGMEGIHPAKEFPEVMRQFESLLKGETGLVMVPVQRADGSTFPAEITASPVTLGERLYLIGVFRDIADRKRAERAEEQASRDSLTELYNHHTFYSLLKDEILRTQHDKGSVSLLMLDIDFFKHINDSHGHQAGDSILKSTSELLMKQARSVDRVCRYGGDEIAVILPETAVSTAMHIAERLRAAVESQSFDIGDGKRINITVSIGVAAYPQQGNSLETLVKAADLALYAAKQGGRNRLCRCETAMAGTSTKQ